MARSRKKKSVSQQVVGLGTTGLPAPVKKFLGNRMVSSMIVLGGILLFASGVIFLDWEDGIPKLSVNREKAEQVKEQARDAVRDLGSELVDGKKGRDNTLPVLTSLENALPAFGEQAATGFGQQPTAGERIHELTGGLLGGQNNAASSMPGFAPPQQQSLFGGGQAAAPAEQKSLFGNGPLSGLKQKFENRR